MEMTIIPMTETEQMYCYTQSSQIICQTGNIGYLRADMDTNGKGFFSTWNGFLNELNTPEFKKEFDEVINTLRFSEDSPCFLKDRTELAKFCYSHPEAQMADERSFGFRVNTADRIYMMRLNPNKGEYNLYCYCYKRSSLERHMKEAERGIRFIDSYYKDKFRLPDGGRIRITYRDGEQEEKVCRYIDSTHLEVGYGPLNLFHICELAGHMEDIKATIEPVSPVMTMEKQRGGDAR